MNIIICSWRKSWYYRSPFCISNNFSSLITMLIYVDLITSSANSSWWNGSLLIFIPRTRISYNNIRYYILLNSTLNALSSISIIWKCYRTYSKNCITIIVMQFNLWIIYYLDVIWRICNNTSNSSFSIGLINDFFPRCKLMICWESNRRTTICSNTYISSTKLRIKINRMNDISYDCFCCCRFYWTSSSNFNNRGINIIKSSFYNLNFF